MIRLFLLLITNVFIYCQHFKISDDVLTNATNVEHSSDPYRMLTPDSIAFRQNYLFKVDTSSFFNNTYCGYSTALHDSVFEETKARLHVFGDSIGYLSLVKFNGSGKQISRTVINKFKLKSGIYSDRLGNVKFSYSDLFDECIPRTFYYPDTLDVNKVSFFKIISYDTTTGILKGRYRMHLRNYSLDKQYPYPETKLIDDGVVLVKRIN
jgi:hypothetical protein